MCAVADALKTEGKQEGILEGKVELLLEMNYSIPEIIEKLGISAETAEKIVERIKKDLKRPN